VTAAGSLQECTFHRVKSMAEKPEDEFITVKEPMEILNINGMIAYGTHISDRASLQSCTFGCLPAASRTSI
jgi:predicted DNA-binding protein with PD1-like motif